MKPKFALAKRLPERALLGCRMVIPDDEEVFRPLLAADLGIAAEDLAIKYSTENGERQVSMFRRVVQTIDCRNNSCWILDAKGCLSSGTEFDLVYATPAELAAIDVKAQPFSAVLTWSDLSTTVRGRAFRLRPEHAASPFGPDTEEAV